MNIFLTKRVYRKQLGIKDAERPAVFQTLDKNNTCNTDYLFCLILTLRHYKKKNDEKESLPVNRMIRIPIQAPYQQLTEKTSLSSEVDIPDFLVATGLSKSRDYDCHSALFDLVGLVVTEICIISRAPLFAAIGGF